MSSVNLTRSISTDLEPCPVCGQGSITRVSKLRTIEHQGVVGEVASCFSVCNFCASETVDQEQSLLNRRAVNRFKKQIEHIPLGTQIREIRTTANLTQAKAGALLGGGPVAFSKYESDDLVPDEAMANLLRLAIADPSIIDKLRDIKDGYAIAVSSATSHWDYALTDAGEVDEETTRQYLSSASQHFATTQAESLWTIQ